MSTNISLIKLFEEVEVLLDIKISSKKRLFEEPKIEYSLRALKSLIKSINFSNQFKEVKTDVIKISPDLSRPMVTQSLIVELEIDRSGSWLFLKIFTANYFVQTLRKHN